MQKIWLKQYPEGVPHNIDPDQYTSLAALLEDSFSRYADRAAYIFLGKRFTFAEVDQQSRALAAYLQSLGLEKGDRVALMMPNVPQYPVAVAGVLRAGLVVVNVNPLYTPRELEHQLKDSGAKAIVILENFAHVLQQCQKAVPTKHVILAAMGDRLGLLKGAVVNYVVRNVKKLVPAHQLQGDVVRFNEVLATGARATLKPVAVSGTTSLSCSTPGARLACPRARCSSTAIWWPTCCSARPGMSRRCARCRRASRWSRSARCRCITSSRSR